MNSASSKAFWFPLWRLFAAILVIAVGTRSLVEFADKGVDGAGITLPGFTDITQRAGLNMKIICGDEVSEDLQEVNGQGACFLDYNNDGYQDIFLVNGSSRKSEAAGQSPHDYLLRNNGDGTFTDVTARAHLGDSGWHSGCAVGDYNNDGFPDLYVTGLGPNTLYRNTRVGTFTEVGEPTGGPSPHG